MTTKLVSTNITTKAGLVAAMKKQMERDDIAIKALLRIYENQTADEQSVRDTRHSNGIGFMATDANFLSSLAEQAQIKGTLSEKQMAILHKKIGKYAGQLVNCSIAEGKLVKEGKVYMKQVVTAELVEEPTQPAPMGIIEA